MAEGFKGHSEWQDDGHSCKHWEAEYQAQAPVYYSLTFHNLCIDSVTVPL